MPPFDERDRFERRTAFIASADIDLRAPWRFQPEFAQSKVDRLPRRFARADADVTIGVEVSSFAHEPELVLSGGE